MKKILSILIVCLTSLPSAAEIHKKFGDYTTYRTVQPNGAIHKQATVRLEGMLAELTFYSRSDSDTVFAFVNKQNVRLIVDGFAMDNELDSGEIKKIKNSDNMSVVHAGRTYEVSTKGSGASMIYITDLPSTKLKNSAANTENERTVLTNAENKTDKITVLEPDTSAVEMTYEDKLEYLLANDFPMRLVNDKGETFGAKQCGFVKHPAYRAKLYKKLGVSQIDDELFQMAISEMGKYYTDEIVEGSPEAQAAYNTLCEKYYPTAYSTYFTKEQVSAIDSVTYMFLAQNNCSVNVEWDRAAFRFEELGLPLEKEKGKPVALFVEGTTAYDYYNSKTDRITKQVNLELHSFMGTNTIMSFCGNTFVPKGAEFISSEDVKKWASIKVCGDLGRDERQIQTEVEILQEGYREVRYESGEKVAQQVYGSRLAHSKAQFAEIRSKLRKNNCL